MIRIEMIALYNLMLIYKSYRIDESRLFPEYGSDCNCAICIYKIPQCSKVKATNKKYCLMTWQGIVIIIYIMI